MQPNNFLAMYDILFIILKNIGSFSITMFGVEITIFTVIYSFIVSKRAYFKSVCHELNIQKSSSTYLYTEKKFASEYMKRLKKLNLFVLFLAGISLILYIWSIFMPELPEKCSFLSISQLVLGWVSILYFLATILLLIIYLRAYFKEVS